VSASTPSAVPLPATPAILPAVRSPALRKTARVSTLEGGPPAAQPQLAATAPPTSRGRAGVTAAACRPPRFPASPMPAGPEASAARRSARSVVRSARATPIATQGPACRGRPLERSVRQPPPAMPMPPARPESARPIAASRAARPTR
jgi:hypothetical protein